MNAYYIIKENQKEIELYFDKAPNEEIRDYLKLGKWRYQTTKKCWCNTFTNRNEDFANWVCNGAKTIISNSSSYQRNKIAENKSNSELVTTKILLDDYEEGAKLSKSLFVRNKSREKRYGIGKMNITAYKDYSYTNYDSISIKGEIAGHMTNCDSIIVIFCVHNEEGLPIGMSSELSIDSSDLNDSFPFEIVILLPPKEYIKEIVVQATEDPVFG